MGGVQGEGGDAGASPHSSWAHATEPPVLHWVSAAITSKSYTTQPFPTLTHPVDLWKALSWEGSH